MAEFDDFLGETGLAREVDALTDGAESLSAAFATELKAVRAEMRSTAVESERLSGSISGGLRRALDGLVFGGRSAADTLRRLGEDMAGNALRAAVQPVNAAIGSGVSGAVTSGIGAVLGGLNLFADGAAISAGRVRAFAGGGVVEGPTLFPMRGGTGLMGEAGPEAILPLTRGADGRLGVAASGGGGAAPRITVNISTPDVEGFRRSRGQIAAAIGRAASAGRRGM